MHCNSLHWSSSSSWWYAEDRAYVPSKNENRRGGVVSDTKWSCLRWPNRNGEPIEAFIKDVVPMKLTRDVVGTTGYIYVQHPAYSPSPHSYSRAHCEPYVRILAQLSAFRLDKAQALLKIKELATAENFVGGKWSSYVKPRDIDRFWARVALATAKGQLGCSSKILCNTKAGRKVRSDYWEDQIPVCVFVPDFNDKAEVKRVLLQMLELGLPEPKAFLPNIHVELGIMGRKNKWGLSSGTYEARGVLGDNFIWT